MVYVPQAKDVPRVLSILENAKERATLRHVVGDIEDEFVQGLTLEEVCRMGGEEVVGKARVTVAHDE